MPRQSTTLHPRPVELIEVAPGVEIMPVARNKVPKLAVTEWCEKPVRLAHADCQHCKAKGIHTTVYVPVLRLKPCFMRFTEAAEQPIGMSAEVIQKLVEGGFVEGSRGAPHNSTVNFQSLLEHLDECAMPGYWTTERKDRYKHGLGKLDDEMACDEADKAAGVVKVPKRKVVSDKVKVVSGRGKVKGKRDKGKGQATKKAKQRVKLVQTEMVLPKPKPLWEQIDLGLN
jgi:hypothetical protein